MTAVTVRPWNDELALPVFRQLDHNDFLEAELIRGASCNGISLWADWRGAEAYRLMSFVALAGHTPFAVLGLSHTGQAGVAGAALLARDHTRFHYPLRRLCAMIRRDMQAECMARGIRRIEARAWAQHPTASSLLSVLGFRHECDMPGFGSAGHVTYRQFAFLPAPVDTACAMERT